LWQRTGTIPPAFAIASYGRTNRHSRSGNVAFCGYAAHEWSASTWRPGG
jgi:hypothetical protein